MGAHDAFLLDAYSLTVSEVVERLAPSVAAVRVEIGGRVAGSGSGFLFTPDDPDTDLTPCVAAV